MRALPAWRRWHWPVPGVVRRPAYRRFQALGAVAAARETAEQLRASAQRIPRRSRAAIERGVLTPTEEGIARLVATGASNESIAASLVVSVRTVETHLTRIYQKTGCRGRAALAVWWTARTERHPGS
jgi:DNA-binding CsgD family transcriptional regulator